MRIGLAVFLCVAAALAGLTANGCKSSGDGPTCSLTVDCPDSDQVCQFSLGDCSGNGTCVSSTPACDGNATTVCGCDGTTQMVGCSNLGFSEPTKSIGECPIVTGNTCTGPDDCDPRSVCSFPIAGGCSAQGTCIEADVSCTEPNPEPLACGCDGTSLIGLDCIYGDGGAAMPVGMLGACPGSVTDAGGILFGDGASN